MKQWNGIQQGARLYAEQKAASFLYRTIALLLIMATFSFMSSAQEIKGGEKAINTFSEGDPRIVSANWIFEDENLRLELYVNRGDYQGFLFWTITPGKDDEGYQPFSKILQDSISGRFLVPKSNTNEKTLCEVTWNSKNTEPFFGETNISLENISGDILDCIKSHVVRDLPEYRLNDGIEALYSNPNIDNFRSLDDMGDASPAKILALLHLRWLGSMDNCRSLRNK